MKESDKAKLELEQAINEIRNNARERGAEMPDDDEIARIKELTKRVQSLMAVEEAERAVHFQATVPEVEQQNVVDQAIADWAYWASHKGVNRQGIFQPEYTLYVAHDLPEHANLASSYDPEAKSASVTTRSMEELERSVATSSAGSGANIIPGRQFLPPRMARYEPNPVRETPGISIVSTPDGNERVVSVMKRPTSWDPGVVAEDGDSSEIVFEINNLSLGAHVSRTFLQLTRELIADNGIGLMGLLPQFYTEIFESGLGNAFTVGVGGASNAQGILDAAPTSGAYAKVLAKSDETTAGKDALITAESLRDFVKVMPRQYRSDAVIHMHQDTWAELYALTRIKAESTTTGGTYTEVPAAPVMLLGRNSVTEAPMMSIYDVPVYYNNWMHAYKGGIAADDAKTLAVMFVPSYYYIRDVMGIEFRYDPYTQNRKYGDVMWMAIRYDGGFADPGNGAIASLYQAT